MLTLSQVDSEADMARVRWSLVWVPAAPPASPAAAAAAASAAAPLASAGGTCRAGGGAYGCALGLGRGARVCGERGVQLHLQYLAAAPLASAGGTCRTG